MANLKVVTVVDNSIAAHNASMEYTCAQARYERGEISYDHLSDYKNAWLNAEYLAADDVVAKME